MNRLGIIVGLMVTVAGTLASGTAVAAGNAAAGKAKSAVCSVCHGATGHSANDTWPNLAGQKQAYLAKSIRAYRDGVRSDPQMANMVIGLTDEDTENLAAYFSSQPAGK